MHASKHVCQLSIKFNKLSIDLVAMCFIRFLCHSGVIENLIHT